MINNLGTPSSELQINFGELQIDTENSATGLLLRYATDNIAEWTSRLLYCKTSFPETLIVKFSYFLYSWKIC